MCVFVALRYTVNFDPRSSMKSHRHYVKFYDGIGVLNRKKEIGSFTGSVFPGQNSFVPLEITSPGFEIYFHSDEESENDW